MTTGDGIFYAVLLLVGYRVAVKLWRRMFD